jgi:hypothetical protein
VEQNLARGKDNTTTAKEFGEKERKKLNDEVDMLK